MKTEIKMLAIFVLFILSWKASLSEAVQDEKKYIFTTLVNNFASLVYIYVNMLGVYVYVDINIKYACLHKEILDPFTMFMCLMKILSCSRCIKISKCWQNSSEWLKKQKYCFRFLVTIDV